MKPVLVTGSTGFLGRHLVRMLIGRGREVRLLNRSESEFDAAPGVDVVRGDVTSADDVERAVAGAGSVVHLAGLVSRDPADAPKLHRVHVEGTRLVCDAALRHGVDRVVVSSSSGTIAVSREPVVHDEQSGYKDDVVKDWAYYTSKIEAEKLAFDFGSRGLPLVVVNPALLFGPGDDRGSSTGDLQAFLEGQILTLPPGGMSFVDARDCAAGTLAALDRGRLGERYLLGSVNWTFARIIREVARLSRTKAPSLGSPVWMSLLGAPLLRRVMPLLGRKFDLDDETIRMSGMFWYCDSSKAARDLGFTTRDPLETLDITIHELRSRM